jgi:glycine/D-amino acid oxidase-like deaminating enzyme
LNNTASSFDLVIVGAGIIGLSVAWQTARRSRLRIAVLDKGAGVGEGSTGASSAVCRFRYSLDEVVNLARDGIAAYQHWQAFTGLRDPRAHYQGVGVLWLPGTDDTWAVQQHRRMASLAIRTEVLDADDLRRRFPAINTCGLAPDLASGAPHDCIDGGRAFYEVDGGYMDPVSAAQDLVESCRGAGVDVRFNSAVSSVLEKSGRVTGVGLSDGSALSAPIVLNAAGPWCRALYSAAGIDIDWNLQPVRIQVLHRDRPGGLRGHIPATVDMTGGIYFRTQNRGQQLIVSSVLEEDERETVEDPDNFSRVPDTEFESHKLHLLHHRLPDLPYRGKVTGYCGLYTMNRDDVHPILGPTDIDGFWVANGFSGHGFKLAPAIGSMLAQALTGEGSDFDTAVPLSFLSVGREPIVLDSKSVLA